MMTKRQTGTFPFWVVSIGLALSSSHTHTHAGICVETVHVKKLNSTLVQNKQRGSSECKLVLNCQRRLFCTVVSQTNRNTHKLSTMPSFVSKCYAVITLSMSICAEPVSFWNTGLDICVQAVLEHWVTFVFNHCLEHWVTFFVCLITIWSTGCYSC